MKKLYCILDNKTSRSRFYMASIAKYWICCRNEDFFWNKSNFSLPQEHFILGSYWNSTKNLQPISTKQCASDKPSSVYNQSQSEICNPHKILNHRQHRSLIFSIGNSKSKNLFFGIVYFWIIYLLQIQLCTNKFFL